MQTAGAISEMTESRVRQLSRLLLKVLVLALFSALGLPCAAQSSTDTLELSRPVRSWEFLPVTGTRAAIFGKEAGPFEAWVYPLKILRDFKLRFHTATMDFPAESMARTLTVRPESASILYASDTFTARETLFVPVHESGAIILIEVDAAEPVEIEADFKRDFQLEWPGALAGTFMNWNPILRAFAMGDELKRYSALVGSPSAEQPFGEFWTSYASSQQSSFRLGATGKGHDTKVIVIAGSVKSAADAEDTYRRLSSDYTNLLKESAEYYRDYLDRTLHVELPDKRLQSAYDWSRVSMIQGLVTNPYLGTGLIAGYRTSADNARPGFAWFFGRDSLWTDLALNAAGDYATTRTALDFLSKYQREDGKIAHEISQSASLVPWFKEYPYAYASADATPLFIIVMEDYLTQSGDLAFVKEKWDSIWKAYQFLQSTYDSQGFPKNLGVGHGWIEGGPLLPVQTELYQSGVGLEALRSLSRLARAVGKKAVADDLQQQFNQKQTAINQAFWSADGNAFVYALDTNDKPLDTVSVLATVPMWFGLLDEPKAEATINQLASPDHQADWGMRIISRQHLKYNPSGYHFGSVWPLFTGWAATGEYRYHRAFPAYSNLRSNALLSQDGSLGHVTEVLSGDANQPTMGSSPHQIWSAAMVVSPLLRGLFGLNVDATSQSMHLAPHVPADWNSFQIGNVHIGSSVANVVYSRTPDTITLDVQGSGSGTVDFSPAISLRTRVVDATLNGRKVPFHLEPNSVDQHVTVPIPISAQGKLHIRLLNDFDVSYAQELPALGETSRGLRVLSESWSPSRDTLTMQLAGTPGEQYQLSLWNPSQVASIDGARLQSNPSGTSTAVVQVPTGESSSRIVFHFKR